MLTVVTSRIRKIKGKCGRHPAREAVGYCVTCGVRLCRECMFIAQSRTYCREHLAEVNNNLKAAGKPGLETTVPSRRRNRVAFRLAVFGGWLGLHRLYLGRYYSGAALLLLSLVGLYCGATRYGWDWSRPALAPLFDYAKYAFLAVLVAGAANLFFIFYGFDLLRKTSRHSRRYDGFGGMLFGSAARDGERMELSVTEGTIAVLAIIALGLCGYTYMHDGANSTSGDVSLAWMLGANAMVGAVLFADLLQLANYDLTDGEGLPMF